MDTSQIAAVTSESGNLKALAPLAVPAIKTAIDNWLAPAISNLVKAKTLSKQARPEQVSKVFEEYLLRTYARLSYMNTIVFGNQQKRIQDLYIPLTVHSSGPANESFKIDSWKEDFVPAFKRVVITDTAGMGKSTVLKWLFLCSMGFGHGIPLFIELRSLSAEKPILDKIHEDLCPIDKPFEKDLLLHLLRTGSFIIFLDGFDEVAFEDRCKVTEDIQSFISKTMNNFFILASRHETALASFGEFREFSIKPLSKKEAYSLLLRYDETQEHASALIAELDGGKYEQLKDLMVNPMLVSLLFKAYSYKPKVPFKKQIFYRQVYDALFDMHDSTKGGAFVRKKHSSLDIDEFHLVMRDLGFTTAKLGKIEYSKDEICSIIKKVRERNASILFQPAALLNDLITTVPLFNKEGDHFKWAHKSVQDYFASQFIALDAKKNEDALLAKIYENKHCSRFENILDMLHDTDNKSFRRVLVARVLRDYLRHYNTSYQADYAGVNADEIDERRQLTFGYKVAIAFVDHDELNHFLDKKSGNSEFQKAFSKLLPKKTPLEMFFMLSQRRSAIVQAFSSDAPIGLLPLLATKQYSFVRKPQLQGADHEDFDSLPKGQVFLVSDDPTSPINSAACFRAINSVLKHHGFNLLLDHAKRTLKNIEDETDESVNVDQLLENL